MIGVEPEVEIIVEECRQSEERQTRARWDASARVDCDSFLHFQQLRPLVEGGLSLASNIRVEPDRRFMPIHNLVINLDVAKHLEKSGINACPLPECRC